MHGPESSSWLWTALAAIGAAVAAAANKLWTTITEGHKREVEHLLEEHAREVDRLQTVIYKAREELSEKNHQTQEMLYELAMLKSSAPGKYQNPSKN